MSSIPFVIGITGHRDLRPDDIPVLTQLIRDQFAEWIRLYPNTDFFCMTSLAEGADQLCGRIASDLGMHLLVPLPMEPAEYEKDFPAPVLLEFRSLLRQASYVFVAPDIELQHDKSRDYAYRQAGIYLIQHCHILLALWDGLPGESGCCGTAETVSFQLNRDYRAPDSLLNTPNEGIVLHIVTPRCSGNALPESALSMRLIEREKGALHALLRKTDAFNQDASSVNSRKLNSTFNFKTNKSPDQSAEPLEQLYQLADTLALRYRDYYLNMLKWLCATGMLLVVSFLLYDELEANLFLIVYGVIASIALLLYLFAKHGRCHQKYIEYRFFAETLRVQRNLLSSGLAVNVVALMPWSKRTICPWIHSAMSVLQQSELPKQSVPEEVSKGWMEAQLNYHKNTYKKNAVKQKHQSRLSVSLLVFTILFIVAVLLLEFLLPRWIGQELELPEWVSRIALQHSEHFFNIRSVFKILLGIIPALTLVVSSYYGKLSLDRKLRDGARMIALYSEALEVYHNPATDKMKLFAELAREELVETGEWLSYISENCPDILV